MKLSVYQNDNLVTNLDFSSLITNNNIGLFYIGRGKDCHVILDDHQVSRYHAHIKKVETGWELKKLSGFGDLYLNGTSIETSLLNNNDKIQIGPFKVSVKIEEVVPQEEVKEETPPAPVPVEESPEDVEAPDEEIEDEENQDVQDEFSNEEDVSTEDEFTEEESPSEESNEEETNFEENSDDSEEENQFDFDSDTEENLDPDDDSTESQELIEGGDSTSEDDGPTKVFTGFADFTLKIFGEYAPYDQFKITEKETYIGRDPDKCQIILNDPEVSTVHTLIKKTLVSCEVIDQNSENGTIVNGERVNQSELKNETEFLIGSTSFVFNVSSELLKSEEDHLMPVELDQEIEIEEIVEEEIDFSDDTQKELPGGAGTGQKSFLQNPENVKRIAMYGGVLVLLYLVLGGEEEKKPKKVKKKGVTKSRVVNNQKKDEPKKKKKKKAKLTQEEEEYLESSYQSAYQHYDSRNFADADFELEKIHEILPDGYKQSKTLKGLIIEAFKEIEKLKERQRKETAEAIREKKISTLLKKAQKALKEKSIPLAEGLVSKIMEIDPENTDVGLIKIEIDAWIKEKKQKAEDAAKKKAKRTKMVGQLRPAKNLFLKKRWYLATGKLEAFLRIDEMDEDLIKDATDMLNKSKENLEAQVTPLLEKARKLKRGEDLKNSYGHYQDILRIDPTHTESLDEISNISLLLDNKAKKIYREAIISESLSLFDEARERLEEVKQITPENSPYYQKAVNKLKNYID